MCLTSLIFYHDIIPTDFYFLVKCKKSNFASAQIFAYFSTAMMAILQANSSTSSIFIQCISYKSDNHVINPLKQQDVILCVCMCVCLFHKSSEQTKYYELQFRDDSFGNADNFRLKKYLVSANRFPEKLPCKIVIQRIFLILKCCQSKCAIIDHSIFVVAQQLVIIIVE